MRYQRINRRHFLQGVGAGLALPFLPSLAPREAGADVFDGLKYFIAMETPHGNVPIEDWCPIDAPMNEVQLYSGDASAGLDHKMRYESLSNLLRSRPHSYNPGGIMELTPVLGNFLNPYLDKLTLLSGLDITFNVGHHEGANLGNYHDIIDSNVRGDLELPSMPTIDRVIARSPNFYGPGDPFTVRSINLGSGMEASMDGPVGSVNTLPLTGGERPTAQDIFDAVFGGNVPGEGQGEDPRLSVVDRVLDDYNRVMNSPFGEGSRISNSDRNRLDEFVTGLFDVEQKLQNQGGSCENVTEPGDAPRLNHSEDLHSSIEGKWELYIDVLVAAFRCGRSRVATVGTNEMADDYTGDWHVDIAHGGRADIAYDLWIRSHRFAAEKIYTYMLDKLDVSIDGENPTTYLDNSIVVWNHESGQESHNSTGVPTLVAGSAGGYLQTGQLIDYRNMSNDSKDNGIRPDLAHIQRPGIPYNRWLYTILTAMGIPESEYKVGPLENMEGYGDPYVRNRERHGHLPWGNQVLADRNRVLDEIVA